MKFILFTIFIINVLAQFDPLNNIYYVSHTSGDDGNSGDSKYPFKTLARAIISAEDGDEVLMEQDVYQGPGNCDVFISKSIVLRSINGDPKQVKFNCVIGGVAALQISAPNFTMVAISIQDCSLTAIHVNSGRTILNRCNLQGNYGTNGGALRVSNGAQVYISNGIFEDNNAINGGAIYLEKGSTLTIDHNSRFNENRASSNGGVMYFEKDCVLELHDSLFISNRAGDSGGAIFAQGLVFTATNVQFTINKAVGVAGNGGSIAITEDSEISIDNCQFSSGRCNGHGAGIYLSGKSSVTLTNSIFQGNEAHGSGAGIALDGPTISLSGSSNTFLGNWASKMGGAFWVNGAHVVTFQDRCISNTANDLGGSYMIENDGFLNSTSAFYGEGKAAHGGGVYVLESKFIFNKGTISDNSGSRDSSGIFCKGSTMKFYLSYIKENIGPNIFCEKCAVNDEKSQCNCAQC